MHYPLMPVPGADDTAVLDLEEGLLHKTRLEAVHVGTAAARKQAILG